MVGSTLPVYAFNVWDDREEDIEDFLKEYTGRVEPTMNYESKFTALAGLESMQSTAILIGGGLAVIIGLIGVLNFINAILTSILTRHREFAMLQSIGMTHKQLIKMLCYEGVLYVSLTAASSILLSLVCSLLIVRPLCGQIWFMSYRFIVWPLVLILPLLFLLGIIVPYIMYYATNKQSIVERLRIAG